MTVLELNLLALLIGLASYRISLAVTRENGPYFIFSSLRKIASTKAFSSSRKILVSLSLLVTCPYCFGVWVAFALTGCYFIFRGMVAPLETALVSLAAAGIQALAQSFMDK